MAITTLGDSFRVVIEGGAGARFASIAEGFANDAEAFAADAASEASAAAASADAAIAAWPYSYNVAPGHTFASNRNAYFIGDSLTAGITGDKVPERVAAVVTGCTITNDGIGGQTSTQITTRVSALSATIRNTELVFVDMGTNDFGTVGGVKTVLDNAATVRAAVAGSNLLFWSPLPRNWGTSDGAYDDKWSYYAQGARAHTMRMCLGELYRGAYWDTYLDLLDAGYPTGNDATDRGALQIPRSLRVNADGTVDNTHPRSAGNDIVAAHHVAVIAAHNGSFPYAPRQPIYVRGATASAAVAGTAKFGTIGVIGAATGFTVNDAAMAALFRILPNGEIWAQPSASFSSAVYHIPVLVNGPRGATATTVSVYIGKASTAPGSVALAGKYGTIVDGGGLTNSKKFTLFLRFRRSGTTLQYLFNGSSSNWSIYITDAGSGDPNKVNISFKDSTGASSFTLKLTPAITAATGWVSLALAVDLSGGSAVVQAYMAGGAGADGSVAGAATTSLTNPIKLVDTVFLGASAASGAYPWLGDIGPIWASDDFVDLSVAGNRRNFFAADGAPADMGAAQTAGGIAPKFHLRGNSADWARGYNHAADLDATLFGYRCWMPVAPTDA